MWRDKRLNFSPDANIMMVTENEPHAKKCRLHAESDLEISMPPQSISPGAISPNLVSASWPGSKPSIGQINVDFSNRLNSKDLFPSRKQREFIPEAKKDESYWDRRRRNNEAAKRSREKRRMNDMVLESRVLELSKENALLRAELATLKEKFGLNDRTVIVSNHQIPISLSPEYRSRRSKLLTTLIPNVVGSPTSGPPALLDPEGIPVIQVSTPMHLQQHQHQQQQQQQQQQQHQQQQQQPPQQIHQEIEKDSQNNRRSPSTMATQGRGESPSDQESGGSSGSWSSTDDSGYHGRSPYSSIPHKLRHKSHLGSDNSPEHGQTNNEVVPEVQEERKQSPTVAVQQPSYSHRDIQAENFQLRSDLERLASEVASLKDLLIHQCSNISDHDSRVQPNASTSSSSSDDGQN